jgi:hypothetical protein
MDEIIKAIDTYELCDTLFFQGITTSQSQVLKYVGNQKIKATTGQIMWCTGCNNLMPLRVIYKPHIGVEVSDVNLKTFNTYHSYLNPVKIIGSAITWSLDWHFGYHFTLPIPPNMESLAFHTPNLSQISIGQECDMQSHRKKYDSWLAEKDKTDGLILWGVSRGTAATFCAFANERYPEVKLVVLEGAIDSIQHVLPNLVANFIPTQFLSRHITSAITSGFSFFKTRNFMQYDPQGPSPLKSVSSFPEGIPVVFISSKKDKIVSWENTERIAKKLAEKGKNDVYLLTLQHSEHPSYMFDDRNNIGAVFWTQKKVF